MVVVSRLQQLFDYFKINKQQWNGDVSALDQIRIMWGDNLQAQSSAVVCSDVFMWMKLFVGRRVLFRSVPKHLAVFLHVHIVCSPESL